jgi:sialate O-acetylesterase
MRILITLLAIVLLSTTAPAGDQTFRLGSLFTDNMVLQQHSEVPVWGQGTSGSVVTVQTSWREHASALVGEDGRWMVHLATPAAGGPHSIDIACGTSMLHLRNVMTGEVWLCSGQSNMEMPLRGWPPNDTIQNSTQDISLADIPEIRLFNVARSTAPVPEASCIGSWSTCSPSTAAGFSATAFHFGRELARKLRVPIGLIQTTWGGTPVEAWTDAEYLSRLPRYDSTLIWLRAAEKQYPAFKEWLARLAVVQPTMTGGEPVWEASAFHDEALAARVVADSAWSTMMLPVLWENAGLGQFDGVVWFRRQVTIPAAWLHRDLIMEPGPIDDMDITYVNGVRVGGVENAGMWNKDRRYTVPASLVDSTVLTIAVRVTDQMGGGGLYAPSGKMTLRPEVGDGTVSLAGPWRYLPTAIWRTSRFYSLGTDGKLFASHSGLPMDVGPSTPTALYNAMVAPLIPYTVRGAIWYQGESNTPDPGFYQQQFPLMIRNWRTAFANPAMPFYYVQIAPFDYGKDRNSAFLREAQLMTLSLEGTGMAVTMDIGNPKNIHPANKTDVGRRLALWALARTYGMGVKYSGPVYTGSKTIRGRMVLDFAYADKGLVLRPRKEGNGFQIAGPDSVFRDAKVQVRGKSLTVWHPAVKHPRAVRYAFTNTAEGTLFNNEGLPASSFRTDSWQK